MKKLLYILTALLVLGGVAYGLTNAGLLQGDFRSIDTDKKLADIYANQADDFADSAEGYAEVAQDHADTAKTVANAIVTPACESLTIDPNTYEVSADTTEIKDFDINLALTSNTSSWTGVLTVKTDGDGTVAYGGYEDTYIGITATSESFETAITISGAAVGDEINAYIEGESQCAVSLEITQAEPVAADDTDGDSIDDDSDACPNEDASGYDTDSDGCPDDTDTDGDGLTDYEEETGVYGYTSDPEMTDTDGDGLTDYAEVKTYKTDPNKTDTDGDGYSDYDEVDAGTDPNDASDTPTSNEEENNEDNEDNSDEEIQEEQTLEEVVDAGCDDDSFPFSDVDKTDYSYEWICYAYEANIIEGKSRTKFDPTSNVTRAELLKMLLKIAGYTESNASGTEGFNDVIPSDWYYDWARIGEDLILKMDNAYMNPNNPITRGDTAIWLARLTGETLYGYTAADIPFSDVSTSDPFTYAVLIAYNAMNAENERVISGYDDGTYKAYNYISREEAVTIVLRAYTAWYY